MGSGYVIYPKYSETYIQAIFILKFEFIHSANW